MSALDAHARGPLGMGTLRPLSAQSNHQRRDNEVPELPEVERAVVALRRHLVGRRIVSLDVLHPALERRLTTRQRRSVIGARVAAVHRRGKHQLIELDDGRTLHAHFRMTGDWTFDGAVVQYPRARLRLDDGSSVVLDDRRALSTIELRVAGVDPIPDLGPDADDPSITPAWLSQRLAERRVAIKVLLLDQKVLAGIGNIYAAEVLWRARIDPRRVAKSLRRGEVARLLSAIRVVLQRASGAGYAAGGRFKVYDRAGLSCSRCRKTIGRITQAGRSTYWCSGCQNLT
jgi:formamidopyrimidine-DNA glycosylase